jgi:ABC-type multidrug transport system permease subunit
VSCSSSLAQDLLIDGFRSALLFSALSSMAEIPALYAQRPIVARHQKAAMYHPAIDSLAMTLVDIPITFITIALFSIILYFLVGLQRTVDQFLYVCQLWHCLPYLLIMLPVFSSSSSLR